MKSFFSLAEEVVSRGVIGENPLEEHDEEYKSDNIIQREMDEYEIARLSSLGMREYSRQMNIKTVGRGKMSKMEAEDD